MLVESGANLPMCYPRTPGCRARSRIEGCWESQRRRTSRKLRIATPNKWRLLAAHLRLALHESGARRSATIHIVRVWLKRLVADLTLDKTTKIRSGFGPRDRAWETYARAPRTGSSSWSPFFASECFDSVCSECWGRVFLREDGIGVRRLL